MFSSSPACPPGYYAGNNNRGCYLFGTVPKSWYAAKDYCESQSNGWLITIDDTSENSYVYDMTTSVSYWIGLNDLSAYGVYEWVHASTSQFRYWALNEPNHLLIDGETEHCIETSSNYYNWNDDLCSRAKLFICENYIYGSIISQPTAMYANFYDIFFYYFSIFYCVCDL